MASKTSNTARLIAVDGSRGADVAKSAERLAAALQDRGVQCVISRWDASGLFGELAQTAELAAVSLRTLSLVYAADLAFRLRWEILASLDAGAVVIAAPYVETAVAFGAAGGLPEQWLRELLRFAPAPAVQGLARERKLDKPWKPRLDRGYAESCEALVEPAAPKSAAKKVRRAMVAGLQAARGRRVHQLHKSGLARAIKAITDTQQAGSSPKSSPPRNARK